MSFLPGNRPLSSVKLSDMSDQALASGFLFFIRSLDIRARIKLGQALNRREEEIHDAAAVKEGISLFYISHSRRLLPGLSSNPVNAAYLRVITAPLKYWIAQGRIRYGMRWLSSEQQQSDGLPGL